MHGFSGSNNVEAYGKRFRLVGRQKPNRVLQGVIGCFDSSFFWLSICVYACLHITSGSNSNGSSSTLNVCQINLFGIEKSIQWQKKQ